MARDEMDVISGEVLLVLELVREVTAAGIAVGGTNDGVSFRKDCTDLVRKISLLTHLLEEIREFRAASAATSDDVDVDVESLSLSWSSDLVVALGAAKRLLSLAGNFRSKSSSVSFMLFFVCACVCM